MAQRADGSVYINTRIDTTGMQVGGKEIESAAKRMAASVAAIGKTAEVSAQKMLNSFLSDNQAVAQAEAEVDKLEQKMEELATQKVTTQAFKDIEALLEEDTKKLEEAIRARDEFLNLGGDKTAPELFQKYVDKVDDLTKSIENAKDELQALIDTGEAYTGETIDATGTQEYASAMQEYIAAVQNANKLNLKAQSSFAALSDKAEQAAEKMNKTASSANRTGRAMSKMSKETKKANGTLGMSLKTMLKYTLGIRSLYALFNKLRSAIKDGFKNLAQFDGKTNASLSSMMSSLTQVKNSLATAFAPIVNAVAPALTTLINLLSRAITYLGMFFAALMGQKTFVKAVAVQEDYAASLENTAKAAKKAQGYLSGLDEIQRYDSGSSSEGYTAPTAAEMFEEVAIDTDISKFIAQLKKLLKPLERIANVFKEGFLETFEGVDLSSFDNIRENIESIKTNLISVFKDPEVQSSLQGYAQQFGRITGIISNTFKTAFIGINEFVTKNISTLVADIIDIFNENKENITNAASSTLEGFEYALSEIQASVEYIASVVLPDLNDAFAKTLDVLRPFYDFLTEVFLDAWNMINDAIVECTNVVEDVRGLFEDLWKKVLVPLGEFIASVLAPVIDLLSFYFTLCWKNVIVPFANFVGEVFMVQWELLSTLWKNVTIPILEKVIEVLNFLWKNVGEPLAAWFKENMYPIISGVFESIGFVITGLKDSLNAIVTFLKTGFSGDWKKAWTDLKNTFSNVWSGIADVAKKPINAIITAVNSMMNGVATAINKLFDTLNAFSIDLPDFLGGGTIGFNLKHITAPKVPLLATGAVIPPNAPFAAILGDQRRGTNIETPEALLRKIFREEFAARQSGNGGSYTFTAQLNRRTIFKEFIEEARLRQMQTGVNPLLEL